MVALLAQTGASWFMTGLIWTMQILNYPLLALIAPDDVPGYEQEHNRRFGGLVGPGVLVTIVSGVIFLFSRPCRRLHLDTDRVARPCRAHRRRHDPRRRARPHSTCPVV